MLAIAQENISIDLTTLGLLRVSGKGALDLLQGQLTCDVQEITAQQSRLGAHCDPKGRIHATFRLFFYQNDYYFLLPQTMVSPLQRCLQKYVVFFKVDVVEVSAQYHKVGIQGALLSEMLAATYPGLSHHPNAVLAQDHMVVLTIPGLSPRFILLSRDQPAALTLSPYSERKPTSVWDLLDIIAGIATIYPETIGQFTPQAIQYPRIGGVSFNKGCYTGQEIIARMHYLAKPKNHLHRIAFSGYTGFSPQAGMLLCNRKQQTVGELIMAAPVTNSSYQALACLQKTAVAYPIVFKQAPDTVLTILDLPNTIT